MRFVDSFKTEYCDGFPFYLISQISELEYDVIYALAKEVSFCEMVYVPFTREEHRKKIIINQNLKPYILEENEFIDEKKFSVLMKMIG